MKAPHPALLPSGFADMLPPDAAHEATLAHGLMQVFAQHGFARVNPPLLEFEDSLLGGTGAAMSNATFRLMDPASHRMMAVRADMTIQLARIAATRLNETPRPLRLSYAGQVVRATASEQHPERQFRQIGVELIGSMSARADAEVILLAVEALHAIGIADISIDLSVPTLIRSVAQVHGLDRAALAELRHALDRKDEAALKKIGGEAASVARELLAISGPAQRALDALGKLSLPSACKDDCARLKEVYEILVAQISPAMLTVDFVEHRGFEYQTGLSFTLFARDPALELGRGGRYRAHGPGQNTDGEPATGFTLYGEALIRAAPPAQKQKTIYLPATTLHAAAQKLRREGWMTVAALESDKDAQTAAKRLQCTHILLDDKIVILGEDK